ncbi:MAG: hypothetical protein R6U70_07330, partial [Bacillota bacterium]
MLRTKSHPILSEYEELDGQPSVRRVDARTYLLETDRSQYLLQYATRPGRIHSSAHLMQSLRKRGFTNLVPIVLTTDGEPTVRGSGGEWFLQPLHPQARLEEGGQLRRLARLLAACHCCADDSEEGAMVHGQLTPEAVRSGPSGELLLDCWDGAGPGNAADDLIFVLRLAAGRDEEEPASVLEAYAEVRNLRDGERDRLRDMLDHCSDPTLRNLAIPKPRGPLKEEPPGDLLARARTAAADGKWTPSREEQTVSTSEVTPEDTRDRPATDQKEDPRQGGDEP